MSRRLVSDTDAVDDHNFYCALLCSTYSTTCCCIAVWTVESNRDFLRPICQNILCISGALFIMVLSHLSVLDNVCRRTKNLSRTLAYAQVEI